VSYPKITEFFQPGDRIFWDDGVHKYEYEVADPPHTKYKKVRVVEVNDPRRLIRTAWWAPNRLPANAHWETAIGHQALTKARSLPGYPVTVTGAILYNGEPIAVSQPITLTGAGTTITIITPDLAPPF